MLGLRSMWNKITGRDTRDPRLNDDGTITTKHGHRIFPPSGTVEYTLSGAIHFKADVRYKFQPRIQDLKQQFSAANYALGQSVVLDVETGHFYLKNKGDSEECIRSREPLGQIDVELEEGIFRYALTMHKMKPLSKKGPGFLDPSM